MLLCKMEMNAGPVTNMEDMAELQRKNAEDLTAHLHTLETELHVDQAGEMQFMKSERWTEEEGDSASSELSKFQIEDSTNGTSWLLAGRREEENGRRTTIAVLSEELLNVPVATALA